ncbi:MAG: TonB-dependent receptor [Desulfobulbus sp.]|jgi:outer membrane cobalamin receptor|uniref:TonB-dependent receptor plug domain-containing protein n=1 Tax=Desulfobulbus sp. TaxID=895 RepID=UPI0028404C75|nr:TonB-dependent receptor [Desulfobulbus sp.]MDR2549582.1 TonB-dependent receptor [Desulfobulbus sp.]
MRNTKLFLLAPLSLAAAQSSLAWAADNQPTVMDEVVVTATKTEETRRAIVNSVVVKDAYDIEEAPATSLGELLANEPGIDWRTRGNYGGAAEEIHLRGMGGDGTLVLMDGVVLNSPSLGSADVSQIPLNSIERVEVVKGPGSLLYGSGAMGGTVNVIGKEPKREGFAAKVEAGYGTEQTYHLAAENGGFVIGDFGYYLTLNRKETDGFRDNSDLTHNDATVKLLLDKGKQFQGSLDAGVVDRDYGLPGPQPPAGTVPYLPFYNGDSATLLDWSEDTNSHAALTFKGQGAEWLDWRVKGDWVNLDATTLSRFSFNGGGSKTDVTNTVKGLESNLDFHAFSRRIGLLVGSEYRNYDYDNEMYTLDTAGREMADSLQAGEHRVFTNGTFAELSLKPVELLKLVGGYRYETHSLFGHEDVARYGLVLTPLADTAIKFNRGQHFKAPTMNDLFWPDDLSTKGNPNLKPETGWHTDVTVEQGGLLDGKLFASVSWFEWDIDDKISWAEDPNQPNPFGGNYWTPSNVDTYRADGWEFSARVGPFYSVLADFALTLIDAEEKKNHGATRPAVYVPDTQIKAQLSHASNFGLTSTVTARYTNSRPGYYQNDASRDAAIELDSYWTVDVKLQQILATHWTVTLLASNLLDEEYDTYLAGFFDQRTGVNTQQPYPGAGRSLFVSLAYTW